MKKIKLYGTLIIIISIIYIISLCYISVQLNNHPYRIVISADQLMYEALLQDKDKQMYVPIVIENKSNRLISSNKNISMGYHLYSVDNDYNQTMISWDNALTSIDDIFNNEKGICNVALTIPDKAGTYIYYIDVLEADKYWFSEKGVLTIPVTVEVK
ncbi:MULTISPECIES: hypothetical protein [unclassified Lacrimispora]|uniref:hypothetical protein n=1 Tax=unclassified Lacrimispora TaxID=2719232 RepID=UPI00377059CE